MPALKSQDLLRRFFELHPKRMDLSLGRMAALLEKLGQPHLALPPTLHIAGTNGKGSVGAFSRSVLEAAGRATHSYVSPHLFRFHERILLASKGGASAQIEEARLVALLQEVLTVNDGGAMTFFEGTTAAAFLAFARNPADFLILETGLGGRLDATNALEKPLATIITPISLDHQDYLGSRLQDVAAEKAGIIKEGRPLFSAEQEASVAEILARRAQEKGAPLFMEGQDWRVRSVEGGMIYEDGRAKLALPLPNLVGRHQIQNAGLALAALRGVMGSDSLKGEAISRGVAGARHRARLERVKGGALARLCGAGAEIWIDGGHNPHAALILAREMRRMNEESPRALHLICGMGKTKDALGFFKPFRGLARKVHTVSLTKDLMEMGSGYGAEELEAWAREAGLPAESFASVGDACRAIMDERARGRDDSSPLRILICGSLYLAAEILEGALNP